MEYLFEKIPSFFRAIHKIYTTFLYNRGNIQDPEAYRMSKAVKILALTVALLFLSLPLLSCSENEKAVATVGEYEILYEELRFITMSYQKILDVTYGDGIADNGTIWDDERTAELYRADLERSVMEMLEQNYRVLLACEHYGIGKSVLESAEIQSAVDRQVKSAEESFASRDDFLADMEANYMTENLYRLYLAREQIKYKLRDAVLADESSTVIKDQQSFYDYLREGNGIYVQHVLIRNDAGEDQETNRAIAKEISVALQNKEHHINDYVGNAYFNEDLTNVAPYYLVPALYDEALVTAGQRLYDVGDATDVIETEEGFWVLQRIEEPEGELDRQIGDLFDSYIWASLGNGSVIGTDVTITFNDYGKSIDLTQIR